MKANTRLFGEIDIADDKIITLEDGMIGLPEYRNFALIFDEEKEKDKSSVMWFQSMDDPQTAFPVMQPQKKQGASFFSISLYFARNNSS